MAADTIRLPLIAIKATLDEYFTADVDLSAKQYYWVIGASTQGNVGLATGGCNPTPLGILQNAPTLGQPARVRLFGRSQAVASGGAACNLLWTRFVTAGSNGATISVGADTGCPALARWLSGSIISTGCQATCSVFLSGMGFGACIPSSC